MTESYIWEGSLLDCSLPATLRVDLLTAAAAALFPGVRQLDGTARTPGGALLHVDPTPALAAKSALLIDEAMLVEALARENLVLVQILRQTKRVLTGMGDHRFAGNVATTRLIGTAGQDTLCDISQEQIQPSRLLET